MVVGFTGTKSGMTEAQRVGVKRLLEELHPHTVVHGDCIGADADFHAIVRSCLSPVWITLRPGHNARGESPNRAYCQGDLILRSESYLGRNKKIVEGSDVLIACPSSLNEVRRSGTWATIRAARENHVPQYIVGPNGLLI